MADASGVPYKYFRRMHMIGELTKGACSMFGAWGSATPDSRTVQLRALDWVRNNLIVGYGWTIQKVSDGNRIPSIKQKVRKYMDEHRFCWMGWNFVWSQRTQNGSVRNRSFLSGLNFRQGIKSWKSFHLRLKGYSSIWQEYWGVYSQNENNQKNLQPYPWCWWWKFWLF